MSSGAEAASSRAVEHVLSSLMPPAGTVPATDDFVLGAAAVYAVTGLLGSPDEVAQRMALAHNNRPSAVAAATDASRKWVTQQATAAAASSSAAPHTQQQQQQQKQASSAGKPVKGGTAAGSSSSADAAVAAASVSVQGALARELSVDRLLELLAYCSAVEGAEVFREPVCPRTVMEYNQSTLGPYSSTVHVPMSLALIRTMVSDRRITTVGQLESRIWHIAANCVVFNAPEGTFPHMARQFASKCSRILRDYL